MARKLSDEEAACNIIRAKRKYARIHFKTKTLRLPLLEEEDGKVSTTTLFHCNISTGHVGLSHTLACRNLTISPGKSSRLICHTEKGLELIHKSRKYSQENREERLARLRKSYLENREEILADAKIRYQEQRKERLAQAKKKCYEERERKETK